LEGNTENDALGNTVTSNLENLEELLIVEMEMVET